MPDTTSEAHVPVARSALPAGDPAVRAPGAPERRVATPLPEFRAWRELPIPRPSSGPPTLPSPGR